MTSEKLKKLLKQRDQAIDEMAKRWEETGELRHLHGKPLHFSDDNEWLGARIIKDQGYSHPLLERARELDEPRKAADTIVERLRRRRSWLTGAEARATAAEVHAFNERRRQALVEYEAQLQKLNRAILNFNLGVPTALQKPLVPIASEAARVATEVPALDFSPPAPLPPRRRRWQLGIKRNRR